MGRVPILEIKGSPSLQPKSLKDSWEALIVTTLVFKQLPCFAISCAAGASCSCWPPPPLFLSSPQNLNPQVTGFCKLAPHTSTTREPFLLDELNQWCSYECNKALYQQSWMLLSSVVCEHTLARCLFHCFFSEDMAEWFEAAHVCFAKNWSASEHCILT